MVDLQHARLTPSYAALLPELMMVTVLQISQLGQPVLRRRSQPIQKVQSGQIQTLIDDLIATVTSANGVGLAAPQVAQPYRLLIVASHPNSRYPHAPDMEPTAMINPRVIANSGEIVKDWEGCLSIPGIRGLVPRTKTIEVEYINRRGQQQRQELTGFVARIFQHEQDHLDGIVFLDRLESTLDIMTEQEYQRQIIQQQ